MFVERHPFAARSNNQILMYNILSNASVISADDKSIATASKQIVISERI